MVWDGADWQDAARSIGMPLSSARRALDRPHVRQYLIQQKQVFRESASAKNIHAAIEVRDQKVNQTARIQAARYLDGVVDGDARRDSGRSVTPGVVVQVNVSSGDRKVDETIISVGPGATADVQAADDDR
jgi:ABC-type lipopolysaccharide export system ATPase subunit